jgi:hypothetical protein
LALNLRQFSLAVDANLEFSLPHEAFIKSPQKKSALTGLDFPGTTGCFALSNLSMKKSKVQGTSYRMNEVIWSIFL